MTTKPDSRDPTDTTRLLESAPPAVELRLATLVPPDEELLALVSADLSADGTRYGEGWLALPACRLILLLA